MLQDCRRGTVLYLEMLVGGGAEVLRRSNLPPRRRIQRDSREGGSSARKPLGAGTGTVPARHGMLPQWRMSPPSQCLRSGFLSAREADQPEQAPLPLASAKWIPFLPGMVSGCHPSEGVRWALCSVVCGRGAIARPRRAAFDAQAAARYFSMCRCGRGHAQQLPLTR